MACQYAKAMGLKIIAIDAGDEKREMTKKLGATSFVDFSKSSNVIKDVQAATEDGFGPHAVILVAVNEKPFQQAAEVRYPSYCVKLHLLTGALQYVRPKGTVIMMGLPAGAYLKAPVFESVIKCITIRGSYVGNRKDTVCNSLHAMGLKDMLT